MTDITTDIVPAAKRVKESKRFLRVFFSRKVVIFGFAIIVIFLLTAIFAPSISPYDPNVISLKEKLQQPSAIHWLGTDAIGRDTLSRVIYGSRVSLIIGLFVVSLSGIIGITIGLLAGHFGGWTYTITMRLMDALMAFPGMLLMLLISGVLGGGMLNIVIALTIGIIPGYARLMCGQVLTVKQNDYVLAEKSLGAGNSRIMIRHLFPNCFPPLIVMMSMALGGAILAESGLSYLGFGIKAPTAAWGSMVNDGSKYLLSNPMLSFAPGLAIMLVVFAFNMVGDGLRDALDPKLRGLL
jgi:ABC-type dipeptide/oligopeptide/nickel transport system permease subunit